MFSECHDNISEVGERAVDALGLCQPDSLGAGVFEPLGASQINQVQHSGAGFTGQLIGAADTKLEHAVTPGRPKKKERMQFE